MAGAICICTILKMKPIPIVFSANKHRVFTLQQYMHGNILYRVIAQYYKGKGFCGSKSGLKITKNTTTLSD
jgi:hypothetical protein